MVVFNYKQRFADAAGCKTPYDIYGLPELIWLDGGPAFNNSRMRAVLRDLKIDWDIGPGGLPICAPRSSACSARSTHKC